MQPYSERLELLIQRQVLVQQRAQIEAKIIDLNQNIEVGHELINEYVRRADGQPDT